MQDVLLLRSFYWEMKGEICVGSSTCNMDFYKFTETQNQWQTDKFSEKVRRFHIMSDNFELTSKNPKHISEFSKCYNDSVSLESGVVELP